MTHEKLVSIKRNSNTKTWDVVHKLKVISSSARYEDAINSAQDYIERVNARWLGVGENNIYSEQPTTSLHLAQVGTDLIYVTQRKKFEPTRHITLDREEARDLINRLSELIEITES